jgi:hypothetical protein
LHPPGRWASISSVAVKLPNAERAVVELAKLRDYCLNPQHARGRHKARVFASALGLTMADAELLRTALLAAASSAEAAPAEDDAFGARYVIDFEMIGPNGQASVRSTWIVRRDEDFARLTSCYVM